MTNKKFKTITPDEITPRSIENLATRPNRPSQYGEGNLDATALKKRFDDLAKLVIEKYQGLVADLDGEDVLKYFKIPRQITLSKTEGQTVYDLLTSILTNDGKIRATDPTGTENISPDLDSVLAALYASFSQVEANEEERKGAEQARDAAEQARDAAEQARDNAEDLRNAAEASRATAEESRYRNEQARRHDEDLRNAAEERREAAEERREAAEERRYHNEQARRHAEDLRNAAEERREAALAKKQDNLSFDGEYNAETNKAATVQTVINKIAEIVAGAPEDFNTLRELSDWLTSHEGSAAQMNSAIKQNAEDIKELDSATKQNSDDIAETNTKLSEDLHKITVQTDAKLSAQYTKIGEETDTKLANITFKGLPDRPFGGVPALNLTITRYKGNVTLSDGGILYLQTDETRTADELVGGTVTVSRYGVPSTDTISKSNIADESSDGIVLSAGSAYIYVVYNTKYVPTKPNVPTPVDTFPSVGIYFYQDAYGDYVVESLETQGNLTPIDNRYINLKGHPDYRIKLYKHNVYINSGYVGTWADEAKIYLSYVSTSDIPITTLAELINSPAAHQTVGSTYKYLQYAYAYYDYVDAPDGRRDVDYIALTDNGIIIYYITAYTVPATVTGSVHEAGVNFKNVIITDTVTEV